MLNHFCKKPLWECTQTLAAVAQGRQPADTVITGARLVNVCTAEVQDDIDVAIAEGRIAYVGQSAAHCIGEGTRIIDAAGQVIAPGFLDGHIHVESSMIGAGEYARAVIPHGTVGIYWDPHEVCNVLGLEGVQVMTEDAARTPLKAMVTTPSCVPAVPGFEDTGAAVGPAEIADSMTWDGVVGLGEMMNFPGVLAGTDHAHGELAATLAADKVVTGHYSIPETDQGLNAYVASGVRCCHESTRAEDALAKMRLGQYAQLRYGSAWLDLPNLAAAITETDIDTRFANLISDDTHPHTLVANGHLDYILRKAVECGIDVVRAIQMMTINTATCFRMDNELGSITPGKCADIVFLDNLEDLNVTRVLIDGEVVAENGACTFPLAPFEYPAWVTHSMHLGRAIAPETFRVEAPADAADGDAVRVRVIEVLPGSVPDREVRAALTVTDGALESDLDQDVLKTFVFERHHETGTFGVGFTKGFGIKRGAMASTVAHDAHNLLVVGTNDADMALAANTLAEVGGGMVVVADGEVLGLVELPIAGLMNDLDAPCHEREGASSGKDLGRDRLHHALPLHDHGAHSARLPAGTAPHQSRPGGLHHLPIRRLGGGRRLTAQRAITPRNGGGSSWSEPAPLKRIRIQQHREGPVVHKRHVHHGPELARRHRKAVVTGQIGEVLVQPPGNGRVGRIRERGAVPLAAVRVQRELAHHEHFPAHIGQAQVRLALGVFENAHLGNLAPQPLCLVLGVPMAHTQKDGVPLPNGTDRAPLHRHRRLAHALHYRPHRPSLPLPNLSARPGLLQTISLSLF